MQKNYYHYYRTKHIKKKFFTKIQNNCSHCSRRLKEARDNKPSRMSKTRSAIWAKVGAEATSFPEIPLHRTELSEINETSEGLTRVE